MCDSEVQHGDGGGRRLLVPYNGPEDNASQTGRARMRIAEKCEQCIRSHPVEALCAQLFFFFEPFALDSDVA